MINVYFFCFFKQKTAYEMRISDWSSDVCSSDLDRRRHHASMGAFDTRLVDFVVRAAATRSLAHHDVFPAHASTSAIAQSALTSSEERRVGKEGVSTCRSRGSPAH